MSSSVTSGVSAARAACQSLRSWSDRGLGRRLRVAQLLGALVVLVVDGRFLLLGDALQLLLGRLELGGRGAVPKPDAAGGLVDEVDGLVREVAVGDVADGEVGRGAGSVVGDLDAVMALEALADAEEDLDGLLQGRLLDHDRLEAALEGGVLLDVLAELVEGRGADALQLAARQRRLEDVGGVDGALRGPGTHERVQLVDEEDGVVGAAQLLDDLLEALLELAAVLGAGHQRADVQGQDALVGQALGDVAADDAVRQALRDGGLADAGLADEGRVVLAAAREDLDDALDLLLATDDRVQLARTGGLGQVDAELVNGGRLAAALRLGRAGTGGA